MFYIYQKDILKHMKQKETDVEEVIVHQYKLRFKGDYYRVLVTGSKYKAEKYMKTELKADEIIWEKSFVTTKDIAIRVGTGNKTIAMQGCFLRMKYLSAMSAKRSNNTTTTQPLNIEQIQSAIRKDSDTKFTIKEIRKAQKISTKELAGELFIDKNYLYSIERGRIIPDDDMKVLISQFLNVDVDNIDWLGE